MAENKLTIAFRKLRKAGYFAKQNFFCCQSCGWAIMTDEQAEKAVFYHAQDNEDKKEGKPFHLAWAGDGNEICNILRESGLTVEWDGNDKKRIQIIAW